MTWPGTVEPVLHCLASAAPEAASAFRTFGAPHVAALAVAAAAALGLAAWARKARSRKLTRAIACVVAAVLIANELAHYAYGLATVSTYEFVRDKLPLHVCGVAVYLTAWVLVRGRGRHAFEVAYYWGLGGTLQALLTPNLHVDFPHYRFFQFFITHGGIVVGVAFATLALRMRPGRGSVLRVVVISNVYMLLVAGVNVLIGSNYMFLCEPPMGASPFFFLPWPWYIGVLELAALAFVLLLYLPFYLADRARRRQHATALE